MRLFLTTSACLMIAACGASAPKTETPTEHQTHVDEKELTPAEPAPAQPQPVAPTPGAMPEMANEAESGGDAANDTAQEASAALIPATFLGDWDSIEGTCSPESDLRMSVEPASITFYESHGDVERVDTLNPREVSLDLAMSGEGEEWDQTLALKLVEANTRLMVIDPANRDRADTLIRIRC
ncbi:MAG: hypothetical protein AAF291_15895 [Pseudomonadota bacterium]